MMDKSRRRSGTGLSSMSHINPAAGGDASNVKVVVRVRPENKKESLCDNSRLVTRVVDDQVLVFDPKEEEDDFFFHGRKQLRRDLAKRPNKDVRFVFDNVFDSTATNRTVYENTTCGLLEGLLNGYNCTVLAYGATGAGKTFTMLGNNSTPGIIYFTIKDLFRRIDEIKDDKTCDVAVSYLEVYNENITDLLNPSGFLAIREDSRRGVLVNNLSLHKPQDADDLFEMLEKGNKNRTQHPTDANEESSRSHAVFTIYIRQKDRLGDISENVRVAKMCLVDLAGSERATMVTRNKAVRMREGANINKSLLALGSCINALADKKVKAQHVPYRNSKLTHLLKDSLGGNCRTIMIAAVAPTSRSYEDTYNTLRYADRAKNIKINLKRNVMNVDVYVTRYATMVEDLRQEVSTLKAKLKEYEDGTAMIATAMPPPQFGSPKVEEVARLKKLIGKVFSERRQIRKDLLDVESKVRMIDVRIHHRQSACERLSLVSVDATRLDRSTTKADTIIQSWRAQKIRLETKKELLLQRMKENCERLERVESECKIIDPDGTAPELLAEIHNRNKIQVELADSRLHVSHVKGLAHVTFKELDKTDKLLSKLLPLTKELYLILKGHSYATSDIQSMFAGIVQQVEGGKEVAWADQPGDMEPPCGNNLDIDRLLDLPVFHSVELTPHGNTYQPILLHTCSPALLKLSRTDGVARKLLLPTVNDPTIIVTPRDIPTVAVSPIVCRRSLNGTFELAESESPNVSGVVPFDSNSPAEPTLDSTFILESTFIKDSNSTTITTTSSSSSVPLTPLDEDTESSPAKLRRQTVSPMHSVLKEININNTDNILKKKKSPLLPSKLVFPGSQFPGGIGKSLVQNAQKQSEELKRFGLPQVFEAVHGKGSKFSAGQTLPVPTSRYKMQRHHSVADIRTVAVASTSKSTAGTRDRNHPYMTPSSSATKTGRANKEDSEKSASKVARVLSKTKKFLPPAPSTWDVTKR